MRKIETMLWKDSAGISWSNNEERVMETGYFPFEVTVEQKEHLESYIDEIDEWCERTIGETPVAIRFEEENQGNEDGYNCECYFKKWYYKKELDELIKEFNLDNDEGYGWCDFNRLTEIAEDYGIKQIDPDAFEAEYTIGVDICKKLGENYTCFYSESTMSFWDKTRWDLDGDQFKEALCKISKIQIPSNHWFHIYGERVGRQLP